MIVGRGAGAVLSDADGAAALMRALEIAERAGRINKRDRPQHYSLASCVAIGEFEEVRKGSAADRAAAALAARFEHSEHATSGSCATVSPDDRIDLATAATMLNRCTIVHVRRLAKAGAIVGDRRGERGRWLWVSRRSVELYAARRR